MLHECMSLMTWTKGVPCFRFWLVVIWMHMPQNLQILYFQNLCLQIEHRKLCARRWKLIIGKWNTSVKHNCKLDNVWIITGGGPKPAAGNSNHRWTLQLTPHLPPSAPPCCIVLVWGGRTGWEVGAPPNLALSMVTWVGSPRGWAHSVEFWTRA